MDAVDWAHRTRDRLIAGAAVDAVDWTHCQTDRHIKI